MDIAMEMDVQTAATVLEKIAVNNSRPLVGWSSRTPPSSRITPSSKAAPRSRTPERKKAVDSAEKRVPEKRVLLSTAAAAAAAGPRERPVNTPPDAPQEKVTLVGELENGKQQSSSALDGSRHLLPAVKAVVSQSISSSSVPGQFVKFSSLMSQLARTSPSLATTSSSLRSSRSSQLPPSSPSASSPSDMTKPRPTSVNKSISRAPSPSRGGSQSSVASASTARPSSPSLSRPKPQASSSRPSSPSLSRPNPQAASSRPSSPSLSRPNPQAGSSRPSTPTRVMSGPSSSVTPKARNPTPTRTSNAVTAAAPASTLISTILNSSRTGAAPRSLNLGPTGAKYSSSILPVNPVASLKRSPSSSLSSDSTLTRPSSSSSPLIPGNTASRRPASPSRPVGKSSDSSSSSHTRPVSIATQPASPSPRVAKHSSEASHSSSSAAAAPTAVTVATRPPSPSRPVPKSSGTSSSVSSLTATNVRPASPSSHGTKVSVSSSSSSSLPPPISVANRAASPSRPVAKSLSSLSSPSLTARSSAAATKAASPASATTVSHPSIPTEHQTKARKSPGPNSTPVKPPTPTRHNRSSSLSSLNFANLKPAPSSASTLNHARASPSESPKSNIASSGECNLDTVPSNSGSKVAAAMKSMLEFQAQQQQQQQQLQMTGFKHSPGSPKTSARVVPEGLPVSPLTLNAKKRCGWITSQSDWAMVAYHDEEWGMPTYDDKLLFELMLLEGAQADLNWSSILALRDDFRVAFAGFDPAVVAKFDEKKIANLIANPRILIPEAKVRGAIDNAKRIVEIAQECGSLSEFLWGFVNHKPVVNHYKLSKQVPVKTPKSEALSNELVQRGFRFVGPTTMYALMQAAGLVNDHLVTCFRHEECAAMNNISPPTDPHKEIQLKKERWNRTDDNLWTFPSTFNSKTLPASEPGPWLNLPVMDNNSRLSSSPYEPVWAELPMIEEAFEDEI